MNKSQDTTARLPPTPNLLPATRRRNRHASIIRQTPAFGVQEATLAGAPPPPRPPATTAADAAAAATAARRRGRHSGPHRRGGGERQLAGRRGKPLWQRVGRAPPPALRRRGARRRAGTRRQRRPRLQWGVRQKRRRRRWRRRPRFSHGRHRVGSEERAPLEMDLSAARKRVHGRRRSQSHAKRDGRGGEGRMGEIRYLRRLGGWRRVGLRLLRGRVGRQWAMAHPPVGEGSPPADAPRTRGRKRERACLSPTRWRWR